MYKITREQKIDALKAARRLIKSKEEGYICHALPYTSAGKYLRRYIMRELQGTQSLSNWFYKYRRDAFDSVSMRSYPKTMRQIRLQWIDWMIENAT